MPLKLFTNSDGTVDIIAKQGESWELTIQVTDADNKPIDLTGYSVKGMMKKSYQDATATAEFECTIEDPPNGVVKVRLSPSETSQIPACPTSVDNISVANITEGRPGVYVYDIKVYNENTAFRVLEGRIVVDPEVSK